MTNNVTNIKTKQGLNESEKILVRKVFDDMCKWLKEMNRYSAKCHEHGYDFKRDKELDDEKDFYDMDNKKLFNAWFNYIKSKKSNRYSIYIDKSSSGLISDTGFSFSRHQFDNNYGRREKTSAWIVTHIFKKSLGEKNIIDFLHSEVDIVNEIGWIDYSL